MSVSLNGDVIALVGDCDVEEAEVLLRLVQGNPYAPVDVTRAGSVHTALWQVMLALSPRVIGEASDPFTRQWIFPLVSVAKPRNTAS